VAAEVDMEIGGVAFDPISGHLFVVHHCDRGIWESDESGVLVSRYGGVGTERWAFSSLAFSSEGDLYFAEGRYGQQVVKMDASGRFTTIAGNGGMSYSGDGGPATLAEFREVSALAVDSRGGLYLATSDAYIRGVTPEGTIYWVAGHSWLENYPFPPYPGLPVEAGLFEDTNQLAVDADDNLYVTDAGDSTLLSLGAPAEPRSIVRWILHERLETLEGERTGGGNPSENDCDQGCYGDPVNTASGEYWERQTDMALPGRGPALSFERTYSAQAAEEGGPLGHGWTASYLMSLEAEGPGGMVTIHQENGSTIAFEPNGSGGYVGPSVYLATLTANEGGGWTLTRRQRDRFVFDRAGRLIRELDLNGETTSLSYDEAGKLTTITDPGGQTIRLAYDEAGRIEQLTDSAGRTVRYGYTSGDLTSVVDVRGQTWRYAYDEQHRLTRRIDPNGHLDVQNGYDSADRVTTQTDANEHVTRFAYSPGMTQLTWVDGTNVTTTFTYDANGNLLTRSTPLTGTETSELTRYVHGDASHAGDITSIVDPRERTTTFRFDGNGNPTSVADPLGNTTTFTYDANGTLRTIVSPRGNATGGSPEQHTTTYVHDAVGLLTQVTDPLGHVTRWAYDAAGNLESTTDPKTHRTSYGYDAADLLTSIRRADETTLRRGYDADDNLTSTTDGAGKTTSYGYDARERVTSVTDPLSRITSFAYDAAGNRTRLVDPAERITTYGYDNANRLTSITYSDGTTPNVTFGYDNANRRTSMRDGRARRRAWWRHAGIRYRQAKLPQPDPAEFLGTPRHGPGATRRPALRHTSTKGLVRAEGEDTLADGRALDVSRLAHLEIHHCRTGCRSAWLSTPATRTARHRRSSAGAPAAGARGSRRTALGDRASLARCGVGGGLGVRRDPQRRRAQRTHGGDCSAVAAAPDGRPKKVADVGVVRSRGEPLGRDGALLPRRRLPVRLRDGRRARRGDRGGALGSAVVPYSRRDRRGAVVRRATRHARADA